MNIFDFHGILTTARGSQLEAECFLCGKEDHLYINPKKDFLWKCHHCNKGGNPYSFLQRFADYCTGATTTSQYASLENLKGIPAKTLKAHRVAHNPFNNSWIIPTKNAEGKIVNLHKWERKSNHLLGSPGCSQHLLGLHKLNSSAKKLWIVEGHWDWLAFMFLLQELDLHKKHNCIAVPGVSTFKQDWLIHLVGKEVRLIFDNDHPKKTATGNLRAGWDGMQRLKKMISNDLAKPKSLWLIHWGDKGGKVKQEALKPISKKLKSGYDLRDLLLEKGPSRAFQFLLQHLKRTRFNSSPGKKSKESEDLVEPLEVTNFEDLVEYYGKHLYFPESMHQTLAVMLATIVSTDLKKDPLWFYLVGPPSSGKSTLADTLSVSKYCEPMSKLTGFHSGFIQKGRGKEDASLIDKIRGKTVIVKDGTCLMASSPETQDRIYGELRDIYDGTTDAHYRNFKQNSYKNIRTSFLICVTDEIRSSNTSTLGERFLYCEILDGNYDKQKHLQTAISSTLSQILESFEEESENIDSSTTVELKRAAVGFVNHIKAKLKGKPPTVPKWIMKRIEALAGLISFMRARVKKGKDGLLYRPRVEIGLRRGIQLTKLAVCLAIVLDKKQVDKEVYKIIRKVVLDTCRGFSFDISRALYHCPEGATADKVAFRADMSTTSVRRYLEDLKELDVTCRKKSKNNSGKGGRDLHLWKLTKEARAVFKQSKLEEKNNG